MTIKLTAWFDKNDSEHEHFKELRELLDSKYNFNVVSVKYSKRIARLIERDSAKCISDFSFSDLNAGVEIITSEGEKKKVKNVPTSSPKYVKTEDNKFIDIGDFELASEESY